MKLLFSSGMTITTIITFFTMIWFEPLITRFSSWTRCRTAKKSIKWAKGKNTKKIKKINWIMIGLMRIIKKFDWKSIKLSNHTNFTYRKLIKNSRRLHSKFSKRLELSIASENKFTDIYSEPVVVVDLLRYGKMDMHNLVCIIELVSYMVPFCNMKEHANDLKNSYYFIYMYLCIWIN